MLAIQRSTGNHALARVLTPSHRHERVIARTGWKRDEDTIWTEDPGTKYEQSVAFADEDPDFAQIGGRAPKNFPTIDDFRDGVGTSLKTVDIVKNYHGGDNDAEGLKRLWGMLRSYRDALKLFQARDWGEVGVKLEDIKTLRLRIGYPPGGSDEHVQVLTDFAAEVVAPGELAINRMRASKRAKLGQEQKRTGRYGTPVDYVNIESGGRKRGAVADEGRYSQFDDFVGAPDTTFEVVVEEVADIWTDTPGSHFEQNAFADDDADNPAANIGGTFPTIDDFRGGVATSLKTINIVEKYQGKTGRVALQKVIDLYLGDLLNFKGRKWPAGGNFKGDPGLLEDIGGRPHVVVNGSDIEQLALRIAIPPLTKILATKEQERTDLQKLPRQSREAKRARKGRKPTKPSLSDDTKGKVHKLTTEIDDLTEKRKLLDAVEAATYRSALGVSVKVIVEEWL